MKIICTPKYFYVSSYNAIDLRVLPGFAMNRGNQVCKPPARCKVLLRFYWPAHTTNQSRRHKAQFRAQNPSKAAVQYNLPSLFAPKVGCRQTGGKTIQRPQLNEPSG